MENTDVMSEPTASQSHLGEETEELVNSASQSAQTYSDEWTESEWFRVWLRLAHHEDPDSPDQASPQS